MSTKEFVSAKPQKGEIVFIHARVVQGAEVLMVGTDAWAQVVSDHAGAEGGIENEEPGDDTLGRRQGTRRKRTFQRRRRGTRPTH